MIQEIKLIFNSETRALAKIFEHFLAYTFGVKSLESIHLSQDYELLIYGTDQRTELHKKLYSEFDSGNTSSVVLHYNRFIYKCAKDLFNRTGINRWAFQRFPSLRVQFPGNVSVFEFHRDSDYNHPIGELNHFLSVTTSHQTSALWVEQNLGWGDYKPLNLRKGEMAILDTSVFRHGDKLNNEGHTRVSIDFRALPLEALNELGSKESISAKLRFDTSGYYTLIEIL